MHFYMRGSKDPPCYNEVFSTPSIPIVGFMKYGPVFLLLQAISLIAVERISVFFPVSRSSL